MPHPIEEFFDGLIESAHEHRERERKRPMRTFLRKLWEGVIAIVAIGCIAGLALLIGIYGAELVEKVATKRASSSDAVPAVTQSVEIDGHTYVPGDELQFKVGGNTAMLLRVKEVQGETVLQVRYCDSCEDPYTCDVYPFELQHAYQPMLAPPAAPKAVVEAE